MGSKACGFGMLLAAALAAHGADEAVRDLVVYGSTPAAIAAAVQAKRMGMDCVVVSPETRIGGLTTGGLGQTDIGNKSAFGGIALEFYRGIAEHYRRAESWKWQKRGEYLPDGQCAGTKGADSMWTFEPSAALGVLEGWEKRDGLVIHRGKRLDRSAGKVEVEGEGGQRRIVSFLTEDGTKYRGRMFIDATYEGDLMAAAGVSYRVGREANAEFCETIDGIENRFAIYHQFNAGVDPYVVRGDPESGRLPQVEPYSPREKDGDGDRRIQAYCFRMCLTDVPENRIPFAKPKGYRERDYELLLRNFEAKADAGSDQAKWWGQVPWINSKMPNRKTDTNNCLGFSTDFVGANHRYPEASYAERERIVAAHLGYQRGLMWTLANHPRVPEAVRAEVSKWGTCRDEFADGFGDGWQRQLYVREARRMRGEYVMTEHNCRGDLRAPHPVGYGAYGMDSHNVRRRIGADGFVHNEGDVQDSRRRSRFAPDVRPDDPGLKERLAPYGIDYGALVPKRAECGNLLVPVCVSATHIAFGSIRMEPVFFTLGQVAATAAKLAADAGTCVQAVDYATLAARLRADGVRFPEAPATEVDAEIGDGLCRVRFDPRLSALAVVDATGTDVVKIGDIFMNVEPTAEKLVGAEKVDDRTLRLLYRTVNNTNAYSFTGTARLTGHGVRLDFETDAPPCVRTGGAMMNVWRLNGTVRDNTVSKCGYWRRPLPGIPGWEGIPYEVKSLYMKPYTAASGQVFWCLNTGWKGDHTECVALGARKGETIRRSTFEFLTGVSNGDAQVAAAERDGRPFVMSHETPVRYNLWEKGAPEFTERIDPLVTATRTLRVTAHDFDGRLALAETLRVDFAAGVRTNFTWRLPEPPGGCGMYFVECRILDGAREECLDRTNLAVLPPYEYRHLAASKAAIAAYPEEESAYGLMRRIGVATVRAGDNRFFTTNYGIRAYWSAGFPFEPFDAANPKHLKVLEEKIVGPVERQGNEWLEIGNELGWKKPKEEQVRLVRCYATWLRAIRRRLDEKGLKNVRMFSFGIQPDYSKSMMDIMKAEGVFELLDGLNLHPGRGYYTADNVHGGWVYRGIIQRARKRFAELGYPGKPIHMTECYAATHSNCAWLDSPRQSAENTLLSLVVATAEPQIVEMMFYKLHQGYSFDPHGYPTATRSEWTHDCGEYDYGLLNRDDSPKPSLMAYAATTRELDGATFLRELPEDAKLKLRALEFRKPHDTLAIVYDRTEGYNLYNLFARNCPKGTDAGPLFRHREAWQRHWSVSVDHVFKAVRGRKRVTVVDVIGRRSTVPVAADGTVRLALDGEPKMVYGLDLNDEFAEAKRRHPEVQEASFDDQVDYAGEERSAF